MLMLLNCYAFLPTPRGVPAFGTVQPMRSIGPCTAGARTACRLPQHEIKQPTTTGAMAAFTSDKPQHAIRSLRSRGRIQQFKMGSKELPPEQENPLKWPSCANLGRTLCDGILPALRLLTSDGRSSYQAGLTGYPTVDSQAQREAAPQCIEAARQTAMAELDEVAEWLDAPCCATVKLDGTNVGIDGQGLIVGRNYVVPPEERFYQKVDVHALLNDPGAGAGGRSDVPTKIRRLTNEFELACPSFDTYSTFGGWAALRVMLYGELIFNCQKYDYDRANIFRQWFCFGVLIAPSTPTGDYAETDVIAHLEQLTTALQAAGWNCRLLYNQNLQPLILIGPNEQLMSLFQSLDISTVSHDYQPTFQGKLPPLDVIVKDDIEGDDRISSWLDHAGAGSLPRFASLRELILSEWALRFFIPSSHGGPLGEGLVVCSEPGAKLTKWKHGGEEAGQTPAMLAEAVELLRGLQGNTMLPSGLLEICERLQLVATSGAGPKKTKAERMKEKQQMKAKADKDALAVWSSTLTKFDTLEATFSKGLEAKAVLEGKLIDQVALDLENDYGYESSKSRALAASVVKRETGKRYGQWKRNESVDA